MLDFLVVTEDAERLLRRHDLQVTAQRLPVQRAMSSHPHATVDELADDVRGSIGSISRQAVEVRARITLPSQVDDDCAREAIEAVVIDVRQRDGVVDVRTDRSEAPLCGWLRALGQQRALARVHYEMRAPRELELDLDINRADTTMAGFRGRIRLEVNRSRLEAADLAGTIRIDPNRGQLEAHGLSSAVRIDLNRSSGDLTAVGGRSTSTPTGRT